jgi:hypothetical protein
MKRLFRGRPVLGWLAVAVALFAVLGHVCALPHEAHAVVAEPSESHDSHDGHSSHDALHTASCEAVAPTVTSSAPVLQAVGAAVVASAAPVAVVIHAPRSRATATSPPLFLLHSALRI